MKDKVVVKYSATAVLWTLAGALAVTGTINFSLRIMYWGILVALVAAIATGHIVAECAVRRERMRLEHLIDGVIAGARDRSNDTARIH